jgi:hypothetical protein
VQPLASEHNASGHEFFHEFAHLHV